MGPKSRCSASKKLWAGSDAMRSDQSGDLHGERAKRDHVDHGQQRAGIAIGHIAKPGRLDARSECESRELIKQIAVLRDEAVSPLGESGKDARRLVDISQVRASRKRLAHRPRPSRQDAPTARLRANASRRNLRVAAAHLLRWRVIDTIAARRSSSNRSRFCKSRICRRR